MVKLSDPGEINVNNISRPSVDELPPEDHQVYEAFIKECEEENIRRKEKEIEEKCRLFLSHFSKNRKGDVSKNKEVVVLPEEEEHTKANTNVSTATSFVTLEQVSHILVSGQEKNTGYYSKHD